MAESRTLRHMLLGKLHRARVTRADLDYVGSISLDSRLIEAAGFLPNEKVDIYDITNGARLATYVIPSPAGSGEVGINGAAAHLVKPGDLVIIASYGWMREKQARKHRPRVVLVNEDTNQARTVVDEERNPVGPSAATLAGAVDQDEPLMDPEPDAEARKKKAKKKKARAGKKSAGKSRR